MEAPVEPAGPDVPDVPDDGEIITIERNLQDTGQPRSIWQGALTCNGNPISVDLANYDPIAAYYEIIPIKMRRDCPLCQSHGPDFDRMIGDLLDLIQIHLHERAVPFLCQIIFDGIAGLADQGLDLTGMQKLSVRVVYMHLRHHCRLQQLILLANSLEFDRMASVLKENHIHRTDDKGRLRTDNIKTRVFLEIHKAKAMCDDAIYKRSRLLATTTGTGAYDVVHQTRAADEPAAKRRRAQPEGANRSIASLQPDAHPGINGPRPAPHVPRPLH